MATTLNFRTSMRGFNREDVIQYIEYANAKHATQLSQLMNENEELRQKLAEANANAELAQTVDALNGKLAQLEAEKQALQAEIEELKVANENAAANSADAMELETYRRAEQFERNAKARAEQIYHQAAGTIAQATTQVDGAATIFRDIAEQVSQQMAQLQQAVDESKNALMDAAATMYAIRPDAE